MPAARANVRQADQNHEDRPLGFLKASCFAVATPAPCAPIPRSTPFAALDWIGSR